MPENGTKTLKRTGTCLRALAVTTVSKATQAEHVSDNKPPRSAYRGPDSARSLLSTSRVSSPESIEDPRQVTTPMMAAVVPPSSPREMGAAVAR